MTLKAPPDQDLVLVGGSGNLARKKLLPAIYNLAVDGLLPRCGLIIGHSTDELDDERFRNLAAGAVRDFSRRRLDDAVWRDLSNRLVFVPGPEGLAGVRSRSEWPHRLVYFATPPSAFGPLASALKSNELVQGTRLVVEKPFGTDAESSASLDEQLHGVFDEENIFRIDHYLGKETVQNILAFRFGNAMFERVWNRDAIEHVQITVAEDIGVEERGRFYEEVGALRDIVQNHVMQVLSLLAMEPPSSLSAEPVRDERVKLLRAVSPMKPKHVVRGQYTAGRVAGESVAGYREEPGVDPRSTTETYLAARLSIDNWRWSGVPFFVRAGKRMPRRITEIQIAFRPAPALCFAASGFEELPDNHLTIRIQPEEAISFSFAAKTPGPELRIEPVHMDFRYGEAFQAEPQEAYERLLYDAMIGDCTLFLRADAVERAWQIVQPILDEPPEIALYPAGSWGPAEAEQLIDGRTWHLH